MSKVLVAYFSESGVTAGMAEKLAKEIKQMQKNYTNVWERVLLCRWQRTACHL